MSVALTRAEDRELFGLGEVMRPFDQVPGLVLACVYVYVLARQSILLPNLAVASPIAGSGKAGTGHLVAFGLPLAAMVCFIWPERLMW